MEPRLLQLAQGGTAVGTGINAHPDFAARFCKELADATGIAFPPNGSLFEGIATQDTAVELSGQLKTIAVSLMKIANDLRWMNSGPLAGLAEIALPALQPGSSIMPGKVNPVIPEATAMVAAEVIGNDVTITIAGQSGNFQLNVMLPLIGYKLIESERLLASVSRQLADAAIAGFTVNEARLEGRSRSQSDPGDRAQSGHRLRKRRGDRQEGLCRGQARSSKWPTKNTDLPAGRAARRCSIPPSSPGAESREARAAEADGDAGFHQWPREQARLMHDARQEARPRASA